MLDYIWWKRIYKHLISIQMYKKGIKEDLSLSPKIAWTFSRASSDTGPFGEKDDVQVLYNLCIGGIV